MRPLAPEEIQAEGSGQNPANNTFTSADSNGSGTNNVNVPDPAAAGISPELPPGEQVRPSRSKQFSLEYEVESVGARGVSDVELWGTRDGGRSWELWGTDPDKVTPFDIETSGEGVYGFRIVVVSGNGLASPRRWRANRRMCTCWSMPQHPPFA